MCERSGGHLEVKNSFIISFSDSLVTLRSLNSSRFSTNVSIPRTFHPFLEKRGGNCPPCPPPGYATALSITQSAFASTSDRPLCFPRACVGLIGPRPSDYLHALSACYYFLQAVFLLALGMPARQLSLDTSYSFLTFSFFFF